MTLRNCKAELVSSYNVQDYSRFLEDAHSLPKPGEMSCYFHERKKQLYYNGGCLIGGKSLPVVNSNLCMEETSSSAAHVRKKMLEA